MSSVDPTDCPTERLPLLKTESSSALPHPYSPSRHLQNLCIVPGSPPTSPGTGCCGIRLPVPLKGWTSKVRRVFRRARGKQGQASEDGPLLQASGPSSNGSLSADFFEKLNRKAPESPIQRTSSPFIPTATAATSEASLCPSSSPRGDQPGASNADAPPQTTEALLSLLTPKLFLLFHFFIAMSTAASANRPPPAATFAPPHGYPFSHSTPIQPRGPLSGDPYAFDMPPQAFMFNTPEPTGAHANSQYRHTTADGRVPSPRKRSSQHIHPPTFGDSSSQYPHVRYVPDDNSRLPDGSNPAKDFQRYAEQFTRRQTDTQYPSGLYCHNDPNAAGTMHVIGQQPGGGMRQRSRLGDNASFHRPGPGDYRRPIEGDDDLDDDLLTQLQNCNRPMKKRVYGYAPASFPYPRPFVDDAAAPSRWGTATRNTPAANQDFTAAPTAVPLSDFSHSVINKIIDLQLYGLIVTWSGLAAVLQLGTIDLNTIQELTSAGCLARDWRTTGILDVVFKITEDEQLVKSLVATPVSAVPFPRTPAHENFMDSTLRPEISPSAQKLLCDLLELDFDGLELNATFAKTLLGRDISLEDFQQLAAMRYLKLLTPRASPEDCVFLVTLRAAVWDEDYQMSNPPWQQPLSGGQSRALSGLTPDNSMSEAPDSPMTSWLRSDSPPTASSMHLDGCKAPADVMQSPPFLAHSQITNDAFNRPSGNGKAPADVMHSRFVSHSPPTFDDMHPGNGKARADVMRSPFVSYSPHTFDDLFPGNGKAQANVMQSPFLLGSQQQTPSPRPGHYAAATGIVQNQMKPCPPTTSHPSPFRAFLPEKSPFLDVQKSPFPGGQSPFETGHSPFLVGPSSPTGQQGVQPPSCFEDPRPHAPHSDSNSLPVAAMDGLFLNDDASSTAGTPMSACSRAGAVGVPDMESKLQVVRGKIVDLGLQDVQITVEGLSDVLGMKLEKQLLTVLAEEGLLRLVVKGDYMEVRIY